MRVVRNKTTGRLVYREQPDFKPSYGIINAVLLGYGTKDELEEVEVTQEEWDNELKLSQEESPPTTQEQLDQLKARVDKLNEDVKKLKSIDPSRT